ncbi:MAG: hypothetical protein EPN41_09405 [Candidimonas sp.]|nr:MAG: hypothetical protein EPN41_09405 [Candidimonas sp.]
MTLSSNFPRSRVAGVWLALPAMLAATAVAAMTARGGGLDDLESSIPAVWQATEFVLVNGIPISYRRFAAAAAVRDTAEALARKTGLFDRVVAFNDKFVLFGVRDGRHWVAEIDAAAGGSNGTISVLRLRGESNPSRPLVSMGVPSSYRWLPAGATLVFDQGSRGDGYSYTQRIYRLAQPLAEANRILRAQLIRQGWSPIAGGIGAPSGLLEAWRHGSTQLVLALTAESSGSALLVHHRQ